LLEGPLDLVFGALLNLLVFRATLLSLAGSDALVISFLLGIVARILLHFYI